MDLYKAAGVTLYRSFLLLAFPKEDPYKAAGGFGVRVTFS